ncbi:hypothetical protein CDL12_06096 [Handroanthus impetiginosus]|uniref:Uncharacterized protein n=1 Tax=Handroanthus impetiginosus TaxID=429701 RepID=A0A2G9HV52_9LAMI|nr:hypothetical protein CDL12_06096 [Handroanthus impetiginosus]
MKKNLKISFAINSSKITDIQSKVLFSMFRRPNKRNTLQTKKLYGFKCLSLGPRNLCI